MAGLILTYSGKEHKRCVDTLMLAVRHNLFASLRALAELYYAARSPLKRNL